MSSIEVSESISVLLSKLPVPAKLIAPVPESKPTLVFAPWNFGLSKSSLLVCTNNFVCVSGKSITSEVSPVLNLSPSSCVLSIYSPSSNGTTFSVEAPLNAKTRSVASWKVPLPSVLGLWRTWIRPPALTSWSGTASHLSLISLSDIGS